MHLTGVASVPGWSVIFRADGLITSNSSALNNALRIYYAPAQQEHVLPQYESDHCRHVCQGKHVHASRCVSMTDVFIKASSPSRGFQPTICQVQRCTCTCSASSSAQARSALCAQLRFGKDGRQSPFRESLHHPWQPTTGRLNA